MYIKEIEFTNFRCFAKTKFQLNYPGRRSSKNHPNPKQNRNVNLFLGNNGSGKSSIFRGVVLGILAPIVPDDIEMNYMVRRTQTEWSDGNDSQRTSINDYASIITLLHLDTIDDPALNDRGKSISFAAEIIRIDDSEFLDLHSTQNNSGWFPITSGDSPSFFIAGYGASRRMERPEGISERNRTIRYQRVAGLFEDHVGLVPFENGHLELENLGFLTDAQALLNREVSKGTNDLNNG